MAALANCTSELVQYVCSYDGYACVDYDPSADIESQCLVAAASAQQAVYAAASYSGPCDVLEPPDWTTGLHVAAVFVVLIASSMGAGIPLLAKYHPGFDLDPYWIMLGKCMGIGVVISCALVHMLQPSSESLTSPCLPWEFNTDYNAYAFLYAVLAILAMHFLDFIVEAYLLKRWLAKAERGDGHGHGHHGHGPQQPPVGGRREEIAMVKIGEADTAVAAIRIPPEADAAYDKEADDAKAQGSEGGRPLKTAADMPDHPSPSPPTSPTADGSGMPELDTPHAHSSSAYKTLASPTAAGAASPSAAATGSGAALDFRVGKQLAALSAGEGGHGHVHNILLVAGLKRTISAYMLEFGVTVHSVFIGLANGIDGDDQLHVLLVALVFHQMFEGIALGSRIADANMPTHWHEAVLTILFSLAAPFGIAIGIAVKTGLNPNGETFLMVQGTFDGICAGILIYIGLVLLLRDFPEDMQRFCRDDWRRKAGMFVALYIGAGLMSFIGKYL